VADQQVLQRSEGDLTAKNVDSHLSNAVLASLPQRDFDLLRPHLRSVELLFGQVLFEAGQPVTHVYFPYNGIIAKLVSFADGSAAEVAMIGRDGVVGGLAVFGDGASTAAAIVRSHGTAAAIEIGAFRRIVDQSSALRAAMMQTMLRQAAQAEQTVACLGTHSVEARLCRHLLRSRELTDRTRFSFTQDVLAQMLAVQRNTVSLVAHALQNAGVIRYRRGQLEITNVDDLIKRSCSCHRLKPAVRVE
jgi:CRP-like cAMP-binding protein